MRVVVPLVAVAARCVDRARHRDAVAVDQLLGDGAGDRLAALRVHRRRQRQLDLAREGRVLALLRGVGGIPQPLRIMRPFRRVSRCAGERHRHAGAAAVVVRLLHLILVQPLAEPIGGGGNHGATRRPAHGLHADMEPTGGHGHDRPSMERGAGDDPPPVVERRNAPPGRAGRRSSMVPESDISGAGRREGARPLCGSVQRDKALVRCPEAERLRLAVPSRSRDGRSGVEGARRLPGWVKGQARPLSVVQGDETPCRCAEAAPLPHANCLLRAVCISAPFGTFPHNLAWTWGTQSPLELSAMTR